MTALDTREVIGILTDNLRLRGSVLPVPARRATAWARELDLPRGGERVLYTGTMYHIVAYTERLVSLQQRLGSSRLASLVPLARRMNRLVNGMPLVAWPTRSERAEYERVPTNVAQLLRRAGIEFGYLYEDDLYTGVLAYDLGAEDVVAA
ncbi:MAG: (Fe-S)-binding protein, partial [Acidimicrobiales bacterium]